MTSTYYVTITLFTSIVYFNGAVFWSLRDEQLLNHSIEQYAQLFKVQLDIQKFGSFCWIFENFGFSKVLYILEKKLLLVPCLLEENQTPNEKQINFKSFSQMVCIDVPLSSFLNISTFYAMDNSQCLRFTPSFFFVEFIMEGILQQISNKMKRSICYYCTDVNMTNSCSGVQCYQNKNPKFMSKIHTGKMKKPDF